MKGAETKSMRLDPRTELLLLIIANIVAFTYSARWIEFAVIGVLALLLICCGCGKAAVKWLLFFGCLVAIQYYVIPILPKILVIMFSILTVYIRKLFPCLMIGALILKTTPVRFLIIALRKRHIPQKLIIPLSITLRYFHAIKEEHRHIRDAMKLRKIRGIGKKMVRSVDLARHMGYAKPSISHAVKILQEGGFLFMDEDAYLHLTDVGREVAEKIYERHLFFTQWLIDAGIDPETAEQDACRMKHSISQKSFEQVRNSYQKR